MRKTLIAAVAVATLATALAIPTDASARWRGRGGAALGAFAAGAIIGGALASRPYYPGYYYGPGPTYYYEPGPAQYEYYYDPYDQSSDPCWRQRHGDRMAPCN